jgi:hypothetical protein
MPIRGPVPMPIDIYEGDRGTALSYEGTLTLNGIAYSFRCGVFVDRSGERFLSDVAEFAPAGIGSSAKRPGRFVRN